MIKSYQKMEKHFLNKNLILDKNYLKISHNVLDMVGDSVYSNLKISDFVKNGYH